MRLMNYCNDKIMKSGNICGERCKQCKYYGTETKSCSYYLETGIRRGCEVLNCDKFIRKK